MSKQMNLFQTNVFVDQNLEGELFQSVAKMVEELNSTNAANTKVDILRKYDQNKDFIKVIYDPLKKFGVTSKNVLKFMKSKKQKSPVIHDSFMKLLDDLERSEITGHEALASVAYWIHKFPQHRSLILNAIDKDLKIRMGVTQINKAFPGLIHKFEVTLGYDFDKYPDAINDGRWFISRKLDGVRCVGVVRPGAKRVVFYSRQGRPFDTLEKVSDAILKVQSLKTHFSNGYVLDGELCLYDPKTGLEDFKGVTKQMRKKDHIMQNPRYLVFDLLSLEEFQKRSSKRKFSDRIGVLESLQNEFSKHPELEIIEQLEYTPQLFDQMKQLSHEKGWEGLIVRKDVGYRGKRTNECLKVKQFHTEEYTVKDIKTGPFQVINPDTGLSESIETLTAVTIEHKGNEVSVGSGFSLAERKKFYNEPSGIVGKIISVRFFEETTDHLGNISLRFPTFKGLYGTKRTV